MTTGTRAANGWTRLALASPPLLVVSLILMYAVDVPHWDTWDWLDRHYPAEGNHEGLLRRYWTLFNGHRVFLPLLLDRLLFDLSGIDVLPRIWLKPLLAALTLWPLTILLRRTMPSRRPWSVLAVSTALTFPLAYGAMWIDPRQFSVHLVVLAVTTAIAVAVSPRPPVTRAVVTALLCAAAALSYAPGALAWPFVWVALATHAPQPPRAWLVMWLVLPLLLALLQAAALPEIRTLDATRPSTVAAVVHASAAVAGLAVAPAGGAFGDRLTRVAGIGGVLRVLVLAGRTWQSTPDVRRRALPWLALAGWGVAYACTVGLARGGLPLVGLHDRRFVIASAQIWLPVLVLLEVLFARPDLDGGDDRWASAARAIVGVALTGGLIAGAQSLTGPDGVVSLSRRLHAGRACLATYRTADQSCLRLIYIAPDRLREIASRLDARGAAFMRVAREAEGADAGQGAALAEP